VILTASEVRSSKHEKSKNEKAPTSITMKRVGKMLKRRETVAGREGKVRKRLKTDRLNVRQNRRRVA
jgi:hypothetical protein